MVAETAAVDRNNFFPVALLLIRRSQGHDPSVATFIEMISSDEYQKIHVHRDAGLEHQLLVEC